MEVNFDDPDRLPVMLNGDWSGWKMSKVQRVGVAAIALESTHPAAISDLTGIDEKEAKYIIGLMQRNGWDPMAALEEVQLAERADMTMNEDFYPILKKYGVSE